MFTNASLLRFLMTLFVLGSVPAYAAQNGNPEPNAQDYRVGPGDILSIRLFGFDDFKQTARISNSGKIHVPYLGVLKVSGLTMTQISGEISRKLTEAELLKSPWVQVVIEEYRSQPVYVLGEVMLPGQFVMTEQMFLSDLLSLSGGLNEVASPVGYLYRRKADSSGSGEIQDTDEAIPVDLKDLFEGNNPELNIRLQGGDVFYVPERREQVFFVVGEVMRTGSFKIPFEQKVSFTQAISWAGGPLKTAKMSKGILMRFDEQGRSEEVAVDFEAILKGKKSDFLVQPNDVIFIPGSSAKTIGYSLIGVIPGIMQSASSRH
jgi:polysaccharide biosynthesis/export protein